MEGNIDLFLRLIVVAALLVWNVSEGAAFENNYPESLVKLDKVPLWRLALLIAVILGSRWCISVGIMMAFSVFFYAMDMEVTLEKWA